MLCGNNGNYGNYGNYGKKTAYFLGLGFPLIPLIPIIPIIPSQTEPKLSQNILNICDFAWVFELKS
jgi:hypothetical protein|tara:strand:- start:1176 stop:1373 length:198 start_codon:yes stop_codon:yes gene_type:complete